MNTIISDLQTKFGSDITVTAMGEQYSQVTYNGQDQASWEAEIQSLTSSGKDCCYFDGTLTVLATSVQELLDEKFFGQLVELGFDGLAERMRQCPEATFGFTAKEAAVLGVVGSMLAIPDYVPDYPREIAVVVLKQIFETPTDAQIDEYCAVMALLKQYVDARTALRSAKSDLQCAIDNGDEEWEHGCRNEVFKYDYVMSKAFTFLHAKAA